MCLVALSSIFVFLSELFPISTSEFLFVPHSRIESLLQRICFFSGCFLMAEFILTLKNVCSSLLVDHL